MLTASAVNEAAAAPGQTLVFCDDTDIAGQPVPWLKPDLRILVAVEMTSEAYVAAAAEMTDLLDELGMPEFHAADMANPTKKSPWKDLPPRVRTEALHRLADIFNGAEAKVHHTRILKEQFATLKALAQLQGKVGVGLKHGLKRVFLRSLFEHLAKSQRPAMVLIDQDKPLANPVVEHWPEASFLILGGPVASTSKDVAGLQLADLAAWSINRMLRCGPHFHDGTATEVDRAALQVIGNLDDGIGDLLAMTAQDGSPATPNLSPGSA